MKLEPRLVRGVQTEGAAIELSHALEREGAVSLSRQLDPQIKT